MAAKKPWVLLCLLGFLVAACTGPQDPEVAEPSAGTVAQAPAEDDAPRPPEQSPRAAPEKPLASLDALLPEEFSALTAPWSGDLDGMAERRAIRVLVVSDSPQFFYYEGRPRGIVAELLTLLQKQLNKDLNRGLDEIEIVPLPVSRDRLIPELIAGRADLIAADLTATESRSERVEFSAPLVNDIDEIVVFAPGHGADVQVLDDLSGHRIYVRESSSYFEHLTALNQDLITRGLAPVQIEPANKLLRPQDILEMVNAGLVTATVTDSYKASYWSEVLSDMTVRPDLVVSAGNDLVWLFRKDSPQLASAINEFVRTHREGTLVGNVLINRYMENLDWVRNSTSDASVARLGPLLDHFRSSAQEHGLDLLMLAAQAYQESGLDNSRTSPAGAVGIMQIKPSTAADRNVGIPDIADPADNIRAGAKYMRFLMDRYFSAPEMGELHQWLFALAAYNAGPAKIRRLRRAAAEEGHDPNLWLENVELIAARKIGRETVRYVRNVFKYYVAYRLAWENRILRQSLNTAADDAVSGDSAPAR